MRVLIVEDEPLLIEEVSPGGTDEQHVAVAPLRASDVMATAEQRNHAREFLKKSEEYLASAEDNLAAERYTPAAGDAIHAGISAKNAIFTALTGATSKGKALTSAAWMSRALTSSAHVTPSTCSSASAGAD